MSVQDAPPRRFAFRVEYDGTDYHGWQAQPGVSPTIQGALELAVSDFLDQTVTVDGASRTDAGVHARSQLAATTFRHPVRLGGFVKGTNRRLPETIAIRDPQSVPLDFAPRFANSGKTYIYRLSSSRIRQPVFERFGWRISWPLDADAMREAASHLVGKHDFTSFAAADGGHQTGIRTIHNISISELTGQHPEWVLRFDGQAFMKQMVRNLVGTLVEVGRGRIAAAEMKAVLAARDRRCAGPTAPARGLTLESVHLAANPMQ